jgi:hypothetical protein
LNATGASDGAVLLSWGREDEVEALEGGQYILITLANGDLWVFQLSRQLRYARMRLSTLQCQR